MRGARVFPFTHEDFWCIPRIGPARVRGNCRCPRRVHFRRTRRRDQRSCRCLRRRRTPHSSSRPLHTHRMHLPHLLRSCTRPRGCPRRRRPVCVCERGRQREKERTREMITNDSIQDHEQARVVVIVGTKMQLNLHAIIHICAMLGACVSLHT